MRFIKDLWRCGCYSDRNAKDLFGHSGWQWCAPLAGTSSVGFRSKNPVGFSMNPVRVTGMTGQSSVRTTCVGPNVCHTTMSCPSRSRFAATYAGSPPPPGLWFTKSPAGYRCAGSYLVTHSARVAKPARAASGEAGSASRVGDGSGCSVNAVGRPNRLAEEVLTTRHTRPRDASPGRAAAPSEESLVTECAIALP